MIKAIFFMIIGAALAYLYMNPGDVDGMVDIGKQGIHKGATVIQEATKWKKNAFYLKKVHFFVYIVRKVWYNITIK